MPRLSANLIFVSDIKRAEKWYAEIFGMQTVESRPPEFLEMELGGSRFYIETHNDKRADGFKEAHIGGRTSMVFHVNELEAFVESVRAKGVSVVVEPVKQFWGGINAVIADPDGNEFILDQDDA